MSKQVASQFRAVCGASVDETGAIPPPGDQQCRKTAG